MKILLDTNVLLRLLNVSHPDSLSIRQKVDELVVAGHEIVIVPQTAYEYWVVATRPVSANGFGLSVTEAEINRDRAVALFSMIQAHSPNSSIGS